MPWYAADWSASFNITSDCISSICRKIRRGAAVSFVVFRSAECFSVLQHPYLQRHDMLLLLNFILHDAWC